MNAQTLASRSADAPTVSTLDWVATGGRVLIAAIFLLGGLSKIVDPAGALAYIGSVGLPLAPLALAGAIAVEVLGGIALAIGFRTRIVALVLAVFSVVTALLFHSALGDANQFNHFFKNIAMAGGLLQIVAFGAGRISFDRN